MGGGLMQLVAYGAQDIYLTGNPQITFWKNIYRRHTNFSMEAIEQTISGTADWGKRVSCLISRNGDLIHKTYVQITLPSVEVRPGQSFRWLDKVGHQIIKSVEIEIGGQRVDKHYSEWMEIWSQLTVPAGQRDGYNRMIGNVPEVTKLYQNPDTATASIYTPPYTLYVPMIFWFNKNPGLALPLIALQYHETKLNIEFRSKEECCFRDGSSSLPVVPALDMATIYVDYTYLDTEERRRFAQISHEYLIDQLQYTGSESVVNQENPKMKLSFNHPVKELVWVMQRREFIDPSSDGAKMFKGMQPFNFSTDWDRSLEDRFQIKLNDLVDDTATATLAGLAGGAVDFTQTAISLVDTSLVQLPAATTPLSDAKLQLNGHDRFSARPGSYFDTVQAWQHHDNVPAGRGINVYSFGLKPADMQPAGTCNMSRIDNATLQMHLNKVPKAAASTDVPVMQTFDGEFKIFAVNYNVLRVMSGMGGTAYSN